MKDIYILGSLNTDLSVYLDHFPAKGETVKGHSFRTGAGGKGLNQAIAAAKLGGRVHFLGAVGRDAFGEMMLSKLKEAGVDVSSVSVREDIASGVALIEVCQGENEIALDLGANETITESEIEAFLEKAKPGDLFLTQGENNGDSLRESLQKARELGLRSLLNPAPANKTMKDDFPFVDYLLPNETEVALLSGIEDLEKAAKSLVVPTVVVTLGEKGYAVFSKKESYSQSALKVKAVDTTGAGDAFCGAFAAFLSQDLEDKEALRLSSIYASLKTTRKGSSIAMLTQKEFKDYLMKNEAALASLLH